MRNFIIYYLNHYYNYNYKYLFYNYFSWVHRTLIHKHTTTVWLLPINKRLISYKSIKLVKISDIYYIKS